MHERSARGFLGVVSFNVNEKFRRAEMRMLTSLAEQMDLAISNTEMVASLENLIINLIKSFVMAIEAKDPYTRGHSERVNHFCKLMAEELGMSVEEKACLDWASILHDVGKIGIPENILNKPDRLTYEEFDFIKQHPQKGCKILQPIHQLVEALPGILHHHERYDGGGYPQGLAGETIPPLARIIAIADTFDAISSNRAYRLGKTKEQALEIVKEVAGTQLDPRYVKVFEAVCRKHVVVA
jgi:HD-GYP domain-containing protein (c-di-GMP phosphodiesterase class II)